MSGTDVRVQLHDEVETSRILAGALSPQRLKRLAGLRKIPHTRIGRFARWSDDDIAELIRDGYCDPGNYGRKRRAT